MRIVDFSENWRWGENREEGTKGQGGKGKKFIEVKG
jgi:hypothetical protein